MDESCTDESCHHVRLHRDPLYSNCIVAVTPSQANAHRRSRDFEATTATVECVLYRAGERAGGKVRGKGCGGGGGGWVMANNFK